MTSVASVPGRHGVALEPSDRISQHNAKLLCNRSRFRGDSAPAGERQAAWQAILPTPEQGERFSKGGTLTSAFQLLPNKLDSALGPGKPLLGIADRKWVEAEVGRDGKDHRATPISISMATCLSSCPQTGRVTPRALAGTPAL